MRQALPSVLRLIAAGAVVSACSGDTFSARAGSVGGTASGGTTSEDAGVGGRGTGGVDTGATGGRAVGGTSSMDAGAGGSGTGGMTTPRDAGADAADAGPPPPACSPSPPGVPGLYVDASAPADMNADGTAGAPFSTLAVAIDRALFTGATHVYLAPGSYQGVTISAFSKRLTLEGGWTVSGGAWTRDCIADARARTTILAPSAAAPGLLVKDNQATVTITRVTVRTASDGVVRSGVAGSVFGVIVQGLDRAPTLSLEDVAVIAGKGANGVAAVPTPKSSNLSCNGKTDCVAAGADGDPGSPGQDSTGGAFGPNGYVPGDGLHGSQGANGTNGAKGSDPGSCTTCFAACGSLIGGCKPTVSSTPITGTAGTCGCGGIAGNPGAPGFGGGASVAILASGYATVTIRDSLIQAGRGGDGSTGATGGVAGKGLTGASGTLATCGTAEGAECSPYPVQTPTQCTLTQFDKFCTATAGTPGTPGHPGGDGGRGGHGWGGPSYAVVTMTSATVDANDAATLLFGGSGKNGDGVVPAGNAGKFLKL